MLIVELELVAKNGLFRYEISNFMKMVFYKVGGFLPKHSFEMLYAFYYFFPNALMLQ